MPARLIHTIAELDGLEVASLPRRPEPQRILMCTPDHFDVLEVKNPFMTGNIGRVDRARARAQWQELVRVFAATGHEVLCIDGVPGLEDMVFAANQVLPGIDEQGRPYALLSRMRHPSRRAEVPHFRAWFERRGYRILELPEAAGYFEGQGDAIWHPGRQLLWGGHGPRTSFGAYAEVGQQLGVPVITLELVHPSFYHLDTCFCVLGPDAVLVHPGAFDAASRAMIARLFARVIEVDAVEAAQCFACNAHCLDGRTVVLQRGAAATTARLRAEGFEPVEVETGEFLKSGGSVFCLKVMIH